MKTKFLTSALLALTMVLAACAPKVAAPTKQGAIATAKPPVIKPTAIKPTTAPTKSIPAAPTTKPTTAPTKESASTPASVTMNDIVVENQAVKSGSVLVNVVDAVKPGWVAIFTDKNNQPDALLGYTSVPAGESNDVKVTIDSAKATDKMIAMLLLDAGKMGTFEYPGPDEPVKNAGIDTNVMAVFSRASSQ
jgi:hypothetical protein